MNALTVIADRNNTNRKSLSDIHKTVKTALYKIRNAEKQDEFKDPKLYAEYKAKLIKREGRHLFSFDKVSTIVIERYDIDISLMSLKTRVRVAVDARQEISFIMHKSNVGYSESEVGGYLGGRDHSTINYSCNAVKNKIDTIPGYREEINRIFKQLDPEFDFKGKELGYLVKE